MSPKALVTGANGFVGSHLVEALLKRGYEVFCLVRKTSNLNFLSGLKIEIRYGDVTDIDSLKEALKGVDFVFHLAGLTRAKNKDEYFKANALGTRNLVQSCLEVNPHINKFVYVSSQAAVGPCKDFYPLNENAKCEPITDYGRSKLQGEKEVLSFKDKLPVTIIRPPAVYGPRDKDILFFFQTVNKGIIPLFGFKESYISLIFVKDLAQGIILAAENKNSSGQIYFIADKKVYSWSEAGKIIQKSLGVRVFKLRIPKSFLFTFASFSEMVSHLKGESALVNLQKANELSQRFWLCDISKAKNELGFSPEYDLEKGALETIKWYKENKWL
ncbi:MAG: NAD-dependent epimerase/dehydratase family protein [Candidatus Zixiibacteriota bacterium]